MGARHKCNYFRRHRNVRWCTYCGLRQFRIEDEWHRSMTLKQFGEKWLPAVSGTNPADMMTVKVAFPFEWNSYESWDIVFKVRFDFTDVLARRKEGLATRVDIMNGWTSKYAEDFCQIDHQAGLYYRERTGKWVEIGDNTHEQMRRIIQS